MDRRLRESGLIALHAIVATASIAAFLFTLFLSVTPALHERIHDLGDTTHQCAVTLVANGNYEQPMCDTITLVPQPPRSPSAVVDGDFRFASVHLHFALLEHAPPAIS
jgi:hypothetical protein